ncbi:hypothetical protein OFR22_07920 [Brachyspira hyodysenteriae]|uniref:Uncharacterized protein n=1 Tax=Brachyspira hyodysenteriae ATCC 27164 TaxID=1266923 RepID=A0A3B6VWP7_BRAHO|nr:hypothetical protein [Brachyspira hyodysenteriae]ANN64189.1 hypothetical protein BHYOB78_10010 [Brachyspira hyodysenteriae ATCC 27164]AUJ49424.1 hypothetical protein BH718_00976 [Brachyspira hyodysenteriae]KLI14747.1 hypothetical protein SU45_10890 [Brachyspira hyodysenteriae]KLI15145.1 hypothetical protein SU44_09655 [Brachyspira hyodysenteriae]KLI19434.1 hypothetical protein SU46_07185 [Brachyspira hyodysenteriae]
MSWLNVILTVLSSANMVGDLVKTTTMESRTKKLYSKLDEKEKEIIEKVESKTKKEFQYIYSEINSLKIVVRFLFFISLILLILFIISLIFIIFVLKYKNII